MINKHFIRPRNFGIPSEQELSNTPMAPEGGSGKSGSSKSIPAKITGYFLDTAGKLFGKAAPSSDVPQTVPYLEGVPNNFGGLPESGGSSKAVVFSSPQTEGYYRGLYRYVFKDRIKTSPTIIVESKRNQNSQYDRGDEIGKWKRRNQIAITTIVCHTTDGCRNYADLWEYETNVAKTPVLEEIYGIGGAPGIPYHFVIDKDGTIHQTATYEEVVEGGGRNWNGVHIAFGGVFEPSLSKKKLGVTVSKGPTPAQITSGTDLIHFLLYYFGLPYTSLYGHCQLGNKPECPGNAVLEMNKQIRARFETHWEESYVKSTGNKPLQTESDEKDVFDKGAGLIELSPGDDGNGMLLPVQNIGQSDVEVGGPPELSKCDILFPAGDSPYILFRKGILTGFEEPEKQIPATVLSVTQ